VSAEETETANMPKMKSHSGIGKRVKITGSGKLMRQKSGKRHHMEFKPSTMTRRMSGVVEVDKVDAKRIRKLLGK
jgi:large subunit ribosomal protein L35